MPVGDPMSIPYYVDDDGNVVRNPLYHHPPCKCEDGGRSTHPREETAAMQKQTPQEFAEGYVRRSNVSLETLARHNFNVCSCNCVASNCKGWTMLTDDELETKNRLGLSSPFEIHPVKDLLS